MKLNEQQRHRLVLFKDEVKSFLYNWFGRPRLYDTSSPERIGTIYHAPSDMCNTDKVMLYALVRGLRPERALEIGVRWGNSARIISNAMEENGVGQIVGLDPEPHVFRVKPDKLHGRYRLHPGYSPQDVPAAAALLDGPIDFAFIDAIHTHDAVYSDFCAVLPFLAEGAYVLFHDTYHQGINAAIEEIVASHPELVDCGFKTRSPFVRDPVFYQGLRLVRSGLVNGRKLITEAHLRNNKPAPTFDPALNNWDEWANSMGIGAAQSQSEGTSDAATVFEVDTPRGASRS